MHIHGKHTWGHTHTHTTHNTLYKQDDTDTIQQELKKKYSLSGMVWNVFNPNTWGQRHTNSDPHT